jgi:hypothetical protein
MLLFVWYAVKERDIFCYILLSKYFKNCHVIGLSENSIFLFLFYL